MLPINKNLPSNATANSRAPQSGTAPRSETSGAPRNADGFARSGQSQRQTSQQTNPASTSQWVPLRPARPALTSALPSPEFPPAHRAIAAANDAMLTGCFSQAADCLFDGAIALQTAPDAAAAVEIGDMFSKVGDMFSKVGGLLLRNGDKMQSFACYREAVVVSPSGAGCEKMVDLLLQLGDGGLVPTRMRVDAEAACLRAVCQMPGEEGAWKALTRLLKNKDAHASQIVPRPSSITIVHQSPRTTVLRSMNLARLALLATEGAGKDALADALFMAATGQDVHRVLDGERVPQEQRPVCAIALNQLGVIAWRAASLGKARQYFERALEMKPDHETYILNFCNILNETGNYADAEPHARRAVALRPQWTVAMHALATSLLQQNNLDEAKRYLQDLVRREPTNARYYYDLGMVETKLGESMPEIHLQKAVDLDPRSWTYRCALGSALRAGLKFEEGSKQIRVARELWLALPTETRKSDPDFALRLGNALLSGWQETKAQELFALGVQESPKSVGLNSRLGHILLEKGRAAEAEPYLRVAVENATKDIAMDLRGLAEALEQLGRASEAASFAIRAAELSPYEDYQYAAGRILTSAGKLLEGERYLREALQVGKYSSRGIYSSALGLNLGKQAAAAEAERRAFTRASVNPTNPAARSYAQGTTLLEQKRYAEAEAHLLRAVRQEPNNAHYHYQLGVNYESQTKLKEAEASMRAALKITPQSPPYNLRLGYLLYRQERFFEARDFLASAADQMTDDPEANFFAGRAFALTRANVSSNWDDWRKAVPYYRHAADLKPSNAEYMFRLAEALSGARSDNQEAKAYFKNAIALEPDNEMYWAQLGNHHLRHNEGEEAVEAFEVALTLAPQSTEYVYGIGASYVIAHHPTRKQFAAAEPYLREAYRKDPNNDKYRLALRSCLSGLGHWWQAAKLNK